MPNGLFPSAAIRILAQSKKIVYFVFSLTPTLVGGTINLALMFMGLKVHMKRGNVP
jgi:hypothetical protein